MSTGNGKIVGEICVVRYDALVPQGLSSFTWYTFLNLVSASYTITSLPLLTRTLGREAMADPHSNSEQKSAVRERAAGIMLRLDALRQDLGLKDFPKRQHRPANVQEQPSNLHGVRIYYFQVITKIFSGYLIHS